MLEIFGQYFAATAQIVVGLGGTLLIAGAIWRAFMDVIKK